MVPLFPLLRPFHNFVGSMISSVSRFPPFAFVIRRFNFARGFVEGEGNSVVGEYDPEYVTFELLLHSAFVADEIWGETIQPAHSNITISYHICHQYHISLQK